MNKKEAAYLLFCQGWKQKEIAAVLKVAEKTVSGWKRSGDWDQKRANRLLAKESAEQGVWDLINYQIEALRKKTEEWRKEDKLRLLDKGEIDALTKMFAAIKGKQITWSYYVNILREFLDWLQAKDLNKAKGIVDLAHEFMGEKQKNL